jgi:hypothetical protein
MAGGTQIPPAICLQKNPQDKLGAGQSFRFGVSVSLGVQYRYVVPQILAAGIEFVVKPLIATN